jgi:hypothetical protein
LIKVEEKSALIDDVESVIVTDENITLKLVLSIAIVVWIIFFLFIPKVWLSNNIYKESIEINNLKKEYLSLYNENEILKEKIAKIKFKNGVTH